MSLSVALRWNVQQIYVTNADGDRALEQNLKKNKKNGVTVSVLKLGGWAKAMDIAKRIGGWDWKGSSVWYSEWGCIHDNLWYSFDHASWLLNLR